MSGYALSFDFMTVLAFMGSACTIGTYLATVRKHDKQIEKLQKGESAFGAALNQRVSQLQGEVSQLLSQGSNKTGILERRVDTLERHFEDLDKKFDDLKEGQVRIETLLNQLVDRGGK
jgi:chaperonin cofactor prefoldin